MVSDHSASHRKQTIEERIVDIIGNYDCNHDRDTDLLKLAHQIISTVRTDERERIREGIKKAYEPFKVILLEDIYKIVSNRDVDTKEGK